MAAHACVVVALWHPRHAQGTHPGKPKHFPGSPAPPGCLDGRLASDWACLLPPPGTCPQWKHLHPGPSSGRALCQRELGAALLVLTPSELILAGYQTVGGAMQMQQELCTGSAQLHPTRTLDCPLAGRAGLLQGYKCIKTNTRMCTQDQQPMLCTHGNPEPHGSGHASARNSLRVACWDGEGDLLGTAPPGAHIHGFAHALHALHERQPAALTRRSARMTLWTGCRGLSHELEPWWAFTEPCWDCWDPRALHHHCVIGLYR